MTSCVTSSSLELSTLTEARLSVIVDTDDDPQLTGVSFAVMDVGAAPEVADWNAGTWADDDGDSATDKGSSRDGIFGWEARTHLIGPLAAGTLVLWIKIAHGVDELWISPVDTLLIS